MTLPQKPSMRLSPPAVFQIVIVALGCVAGLLYGVAVEGNTPTAGVIYGGCIALMVSLFDRSTLLGAIHERMRRWPTLLYIPASEAVYLVLVSFGFALGGLLTWSFGIVRKPLLTCMIPEFQTLIYALLVSGCLVFVTRVRDLLGHSVFTNLLLGRYHRPVEEERIFLFLDLVGSTGYARSHGDLRAQQYLAAIFAALAEPVRDHAGTIDDYIGDMALITWPVKRGATGAACIRCVFAIHETIERDALSWQRRFGQVPVFRAALHGGSIVTAEVGIDRHKISYFGDVVNTTSRIETLSRHLDVLTLISADLLLRCGTLPADLKAWSLGSHVLRGREEQLEVFGLERIEAPQVARSGPRPRLGAVSAALARG